MFIDIDCNQLKNIIKMLSEITFVSKRYPDEAKLIAVLSDGLGSGIKAKYSILYDCNYVKVRGKFTDSN